MKRRNEKGQSLVEFALVVPLVILILMAIIEFGFMFNAYITISNASREGARLGALGSNDAAVVTRVVDTSVALDPAKLSVTITPANRSRGDMIRVQVNYDYVLITPIVSSVLSPFIDLEAETVMRVE
ncbi:MAG: pilus assembly protein [Clostridiales bacterium]|nr:pilus assembly protein [Clostridiales bacterium]